MSKSFKFKDNNYLDSSSIVYGHDLLTNRLKRLGRLRCITQSTNDKFYTDFDLGYDSSNPYDRRIYIYFGIGNNMLAYAGIFTYQNGSVSSKVIWSGTDIKFTENTDKTIRITLGTNWVTISLISVYPE